MSNTSRDEVLDAIARDLQDVLQSLSQVSRRRDQQLLNAIEKILASTGQPVEEQRDFIPPIYAETLLDDICERIGFGQILTGKHREYALHVLQALRMGRTASQAMGTNKRGSPPREWNLRERRQDGRVIISDVHTIYAEVNDRWHGRTKDSMGRRLPTCSKTVAQAYVAAKFSVDVKTVVRGYDNARRIVGAQPLPRGRPKKSK